MKYLITRKSKKLTKNLNNKKFEIIIPENQMIEVAYKTSAGQEKKEQIIGAYVYLKMGESVFPSIVEFSSDEVEIIGEVIGKNDLLAKATDEGKMFFVNGEICTCQEFVGEIGEIDYENFTILNNNENMLRVTTGRRNMITANRNKNAGKTILTIAF
jgi:hypothetical protein